MGTRVKAKRIIIFNRYKYYGGTLVLSCLCKTLRELGYDARLFMCTDIPFNEYDERHFIKMNFKRLVKRQTKELVCKFLEFLPPFTKTCVSGSEITSINMDGLAFQWNPFFDKDNTIVIYPEVTFGNPLHAKGVVRWLMYHYPYKEGSSAYSSNDFFIAYRDVYNSTFLNPKCNMVTLSYFDSKLYYQYNFGERSGKCYILRKGRNRPDVPKSFDGPVFDDNMSQQELVKMFNEHEYCYSYDTQTFYTIIAAVCGCIPIVVMEPGKVESNYLGVGETHEGVAFGDAPKEIEYAIRSRDQLLKKLDFSDSNKQNALHLIELLEERFGKIATISI